MLIHIINQLLNSAYSNHEYYTSTLTVTLSQIEYSRNRLKFLNGHRPPKAMTGLGEFIFIFVFLTQHTITECY